MFSLVGIPSNIRKEDTWFTKYGNSLLDYNIKKSIKWYNDNYYYVGSYHILYKIIEGFAISKKLDEEYMLEYFNSIYQKNKAFHHANSLGLSSDISIGRIHYGNFYGPNTKEIIVQVDNYWDWDWVKYRWKKLSPVKVLRHDQNHISFNLMTNKNYIEHKCFSIIQIDINLLHMQYVAWLFYHKKIKQINPDHKTPNTGYFLGMVVLPNMLPSHINQVIINKNTMLTDDSMPKTIDYAGTSFYVNSDMINKHLDSNIDDVFHRARMSEYSIERIAQNIHGVNDVRAYEFMDTPNILLNRQNKWIYVLAMSRFLRHCLLTPQSRSKNINNNYLSKLRTSLISLQKGRVFRDSAISELEGYYTEEIEWLFSI